MEFHRPVLAKGEGRRVKFLHSSDVIIDFGNSRSRDVNAEDRRRCQMCGHGGVTQRSSVALHGVTSRVVWALTRPEARRRSERAAEGRLNLPGSQHCKR